jgi:uncharacterized membrane protein YhaH (DUF805 family)
MSFSAAIKSCFANYVTFSGRARRSEYWWFVLFNLLLSIVAWVLDAAVGTPIFAALVTAGLLLPGLAVTVRRLHDRGRSGFWVFIALVPFVGAVVLLVFVCQDSTPGDNAYGPSPKAVPALA